MLVRYAPDRRPLPAETPVHTVWIWLVLLLPLVSVVASLATIGAVTRTVGDLAHPGTIALSAMYSPGDVVGLVLSCVVVALVIVFSWLDYRDLERRGVDRPFPWAWSFLAWPVYTIGRAVIVRRVAGGRGSAVLWASIAVLVVSLAAGIATVLILTPAVVQMVHQLRGAGA